MSTATRPRTSSGRRPSKKSRRRVPLPLLLAVAVVVLLGLAFALSSSGTEPLSTQTAPVQVDGDALPPFSSGEADAAIGMGAPGLAGSDFGGAPVSFEPGEGPTVVVFGAHWCQFCQKEVQELSPWLADGGADAHGVDVIAVSAGVDPKAPNYPPSAWFEREGWPNPVLRDDQAGAAAQAYGLTAYPFFVFIDGDGEVLGRISGAMGTEAFDVLLGRTSDA